MVSFISYYIFCAKYNSGLLILVAKVFKQIPEKPKAAANAPRNNESNSNPNTNDPIVKPRKANARFVNKLHEGHEAFKLALDIILKQTSKSNSKIFKAVLYIPDIAREIKELGKYF